MSQSYTKCNLGTSPGQIVNFGELFVPEDRPTKSRPQRLIRFHTHQISREAKAGGPITNEPKALTAQDHAPDQSTTNVTSIKLTSCTGLEEWPRRADPREQLMMDTTLV